jgi:hypothetical protein
MSLLRMARLFDNQEIKMNASLRAPMALGFILAVPLFALPALSASGPEVKYNHRVSHNHRVAHIAKAEALVSLAAPVPREPETDGLSRNDEDCNMACIDH